MASCFDCLAIVLLIAHLAGRGEGMLYCGVCLLLSGCVCLIISLVLGATGLDKDALVLDGAGFGCTLGALCCGLVGVVLPYILAQLPRFLKGPPPKGNTEVEKAEEETPQVDLAGIQRIVEAGANEEETNAQRRAQTLVAIGDAPKAPDTSMETMLPEPLALGASLSTLTDAGAGFGILALPPPVLAPLARPDDPAVRKGLGRFLEGDGLIYAIQDGRLSSRPSAAGGWSARTSRSTGKKYYVNEQTGQAQWEKPEEHGASDAGSEPSWTSRPDPAEGWTMKRSKRTGQVYSVRQAW
jgi:hypothetical protein